MDDEIEIERVELLMTPMELKAVDEWSAKNRIRVRSEAIRRLCQMGIGLDLEAKGLLEKSDLLPSLLSRAFEALIVAIQTGQTDAEELTDTISDSFRALQDNQENLSSFLQTIGVLKINITNSIYTYDRTKKAVQQWNDNKICEADQAN